MDKSKFYKPTDKYCLEFPELTIDLITDWFNVDLIHISNYDITKTDFLDFYKSFQNRYDFHVGIEEVQENFKDFPTDDFSEIVTNLLNKTYNNE